MENTLLISIEIATFLVVFMVILAVSRAVSQRVAIEKRLSERKDQPARQSSRLLKSLEVRNPFLSWIQSTTLDQDVKEKTELQKKLALAGYSSPAAAAVFVTGRLVLAAGLPVLFVLFQSFSPNPSVGLPAILTALMFSGIGLIAPRILLDGRVAARKDAMERQFPDALDLMVVCVEAGLGLEGAILRVGQETAVSHPLISQQLRAVSHELNAGRSRPDALRGLADRTNFDSINAFVALLIQTDQLGVSYANTLRTFSAEIREKRYMKAEEKAMRIPLLITIPLVFFILPALVIAAMLPAMIEAQHGFASMVSAGHPK